AGLCVALVERRRPLVKRSLAALAVGFSVGITATFLATLAFDGLNVIPEEFNPTDHPLTGFISDPNFFSFFVAFVAGIAGVLSLTSSKSGALIGVLISVTTIPAASNIGVATALGEWGEAGGAAAQLGLNLVTIVLAGAATLYVQRRWYVDRRVKHLADPARSAAGLPLGRSARSGRGPKG
ncbi:MAG: DUF389 domain-containing protein, partial [Solirubrobacterales bacterium]